MKQDTNEMELLKGIGISQECLNTYASAVSEAEQMMVLKQWRCRLLKEIHRKQKLLDQIDYLIHLKQKEGTV
ncbi:MAG: hypothetical protein LKF79_01975 [Solobacterium sp.]|jgi:hypothetical protein|nr:hypothetical protein [Solobacterium sp.]MCH4222576.1 hypothetical protein [Solobacterium sp.]MCH4265395.1 hypothetical protein [Solobacterium sp.]